MILRSLQVEGWRCFARRVMIGPLVDRINVVHGPNGIGKSTLMWALVRGLMDNHAVGGAAVAAALQPRGRVLAPRVSIEFEHDGRRYRTAKQFVVSPSSVLERLEDGRYVPLAEGAASDARLRQMLGGAAPSRGFTEEKHWGMAQVLWAPQDRLQLPELATDVAGAIRASLGAQMTDPRQDAVERAIAACYGEIYTPGGKLKGGQKAPLIVTLRKELAAAEGRHDVLRQKLADFGAAGRQIQQLHAARDQARQDLARLDCDLEAAREKEKQFNAARAERDRQQEAVGAARERHENLNRRIADIKTLRGSLAKAAADIERLQSDLPELQQAMADCAREADKARTVLEALRGRRNEADIARRTAQAARQFTDAMAARAQTEQLITRAGATEEELRHLTEKRGKLTAPDLTRLREIEAEEGRRRDAATRLAAAMITVSIVPEADLQLEVMSGEQPGVRIVAPGNPCNLQGDSDVAFHISGVGQFRATGPSGSSVDQLRRQLAQAEENLTQLTNPFGTCEPVKLQTLHDEAAELDQAIAAMVIRRETLLGDLTIDELRRRRDAAAALVEATLAEYADWAALPPDAEQLDAEARRIAETHAAEIQSAESQRDAAEAARASADRAYETHQAKIAALQQQMSDAQKRLDELTADGCDDDARTKAQGEAALAWNAAKALVNKAEKELEGYGEDPGEEVERLKGRMTALAEASRQAERQLGEVEGRLEQMVAEAPYSALVEVEEHIERLRVQIAAEQVRNDAVRLLYETVGQCREAAVGAVIGPVQRRASETLRRIAGPGLGAIRLDESFLPGGVEPESFDGHVGIDELSGGEREQVHLAVRLALAEVLWEDQRQLLVLDDVLTATDPARLERTLDILGEAAERFQILILTCHPNRYQGLAEAMFVDLEEHIRPGE